MAVELSATRDKLTKETEKRLRAEAALRQATDRLASPPYHLRKTLSQSEFTSVLRGRARGFAGARDRGGCM